MQSCYGQCSSILNHCQNQEDSCNTSCLNTYSACYYSCSGKDVSACRQDCLDAKADCNNDCNSDEQVCLNSSYNFGWPVWVENGYQACRDRCQQARSTCQANYNDACTNYCENSLGIPTPTPTPTPEPSPSPTPTPTPTPTAPTGCNPATCCAGGWGGYVIDNGRGGYAHPVQTTTSFKNWQNKSLNMSIDLTRGDATTIINVDGTPTVQTPAEQAASFNHTIEDPNIFNGDKPALFQFERYKAAAVATGNYYSSWCDFESNVINTEDPQTGIVYVDLHKGEGCLDSTTLHTVNSGSGSLNVVGTFALGLNGFSNAEEQRAFKIALEVPINVNPIVGPVTGSTDLDHMDFLAFKAAAEAGTFNPTGSDSPYEVAWSTTIPASGKSPIGIDLGSDFAPFSADEDFPAIMYQDSIFDIEGGINASGTVYSPGFIEIEHWQTPRNKSNFINGAMIAGRGMLLGAIRADGGSCTGGTFTSFDPNSIDGLGVFVPSMLTRVGHIIEE